MNLNRKDNFINQISIMTDDELENVDIEVFLVSKASTTDQFYNTKKEYLDTEVIKWIKTNIRAELNNLKFKDENSSKRFYIMPYDLELQKTDYIAALNLEKEPRLKTRKDSLLNSIKQNIDIEDKEVKFQIIKLINNDKVAYFIYYRGIKLSAAKRKNAKRMPTIRHKDQLTMQEYDVVEFGGKIELIILDDYFYIVSPRTLEYTFEFTDHISRRRDENLKNITNMNFFKDDPNLDLFIGKSSQYMISRRLASIEKETLDILEEAFMDRCKELKEIKENIPIETKERQEYLDKYEVLQPLYDHIDVLEKKIKVNPEKSIEPLIDFFADKIVESFLTKELKETP